MCVGFQLEKFENKSIDNMNAMGIYNNENKELQESSSTRDLKKLSFRNIH